MNVQLHMVRDPFTANLNDGLHQTYQRMRERSIRHLPVLDDHGKLAGIISERDLLRPAFVDPEPNRSGAFILDNSVTVAKAMSVDPVTLAADDSVAHALDLFLEHKFGALPVVDSDGHLLGILSTVDLLAVLREKLG